MASDGPRLWGTQRPFPSRLEREGESFSLGLEGDGWRGGGRHAPWRTHDRKEERRGSQSPNMEDRGEGSYYGVSSDMGSRRRRPWLPPREGDEEEEGSWGTNRGPQEPRREYRSPEQEGKRGSCEPPRKRARSSPMGEWLRDPMSRSRKYSWETPQKKVQSPPIEEWRRVSLTPPRGRGSTSPKYQRQPCAHATHRETSSRSSGRDSPSNGGSPWVSRGRDGLTTESRGKSRESPEPAWESHRDPGMSLPTSQRAMEGRDSDRSRCLEEPCSSSSRRYRSRGDPGWETRHGNPVDGSYSVKAGESRECRSRRGFQSFQRQIHSRERGNRGLKGWQDEGWARDEGLSREDRGWSMESPRESLPQKGQGAEESFRRNFLGPESGSERYEGQGTHAATTEMFSPRLEVVNYWTRCHYIMLKNERDKFLSFCPRPYIPGRSSVPPIVNPDLERLVEKHTKSLSTNVRFLLQAQWDILTMLAPAMVVYEMAEAAIEKQEALDPLAVRPLARCLLSFAGSANRKLTLQRSSDVLQAIDPHLVSMVNKMSNLNSGGRLFAEDDVDILKGVICRLEMLLEEPPDRNSGNRWKARRHTLMDSHRDSAPRFQGGSASSSEMRSDRRVQLPKKSSLDLWHRRFGHTNSYKILCLQRDKHVVGMKIDPGESNSTTVCVTCLTVWGPTPLFPCNTVRNTTALMDLVHCELSGPFDMPSLTLHRYAFIFVEDFSRFCVTYLLKETGEMHGCFEKYLSLLRQRRKSTPKAFQMNSAADAVSPQTLNFLEAQGIAHKRGVESVHGKSRMAEKEMKTLLEMTHCMLADAVLPKPFWGQAILAATYLLNRLPIKRKKRTRFHLWYGRVPNVRHLRVFGSLVCNKQELTGRDAQHVFIGYSSYNLSYKLINLETGVIVFTRIQDFDERKEVKKKGKFLEAIERCGCDIEALTDIVVSLMPQPEHYTPLAGGETEEETSTPKDGNGDEED